MQQSVATEAFAAAFDDRLWPAWTERMVDEFGGAGGQLVVVDAAASGVERRLFVRADPDALCHYEREGLARFDPQVPYLVRLRGRAVFTDTDHVDPHDAGAARHADFLARYIGWGHYLTAVAPICAGAESVVVGLSIHKRQGSDPVPTSDRQRLAAILPQINDAMALAFRHSTLLVDAFWEGHCGVADEPSLLLDEKGRVIRKSPSLDALLRRTDAVLTLNGTLVTSSSSAQRRLEEAIARAVRREEPMGSAVLLPSQSGGVTLVASLRPIPWSCRMMAPAEAAAILTLVDPTHRPIAKQKAWASAFGLTAREAGLVELLIEGHSLQTAAAARQREIGTVRAQLRSVFEKTGVSRQSDLISLLTRVG